MAKKTQEELGEDLCNYCDLEDSHRGAKCYGGAPTFCWDSGYCELAYKSYLESDEDEEN